MDGSGFVVRLLPDSADTTSGMTGPGFIVLMLPDAGGSGGFDLALPAATGAVGALSVSISPDLLLAGSIGTGASGTPLPQIEQTPADVVGTGAAGLVFGQGVDGSAGGPGFIVLMLPGADAAPGSPTTLAAPPGAISIGALAWESACPLPSTAGTGAAGTLTRSPGGGAGGFSSGFSSGFSK